MNIYQSTKYSLKIMNANRIRTFFTVLGILIGIATVIVVYSAGEGIRGLLVGQIESFGTDIVQTEIKVPSNKKGTQGDAESANAMALGAQVTTLTVDDMDAINKLNNVRGSYSVIMGQEQIGYNNEIKRSFIMGTSPDYINIDKSSINYGRFFSEEDDKSLAQVVVLGSKMKDKLFGDSNPLGKRISLRGKKFEVIGVMNKKGAVMFMDFDNYVYVPIRTLQRKIMGVKYVSYMIHGLKDVKKAEETADEIRYLLRDRHDISDPVKDDFRVSTMEEAMKILGTVTGAITLLLLAIVIISLIVGGVGIMNVMYILVTERTMEIGLRKTVGAKKADILTQFLVDSIIITSFGGVLGILLGILLSYIVALIAKKYDLPWDFVIPLKAYVVALSFSFVFGILFGVYPAKKAANLDPIESLRVE